MALSIFSVHLFVCLSPKTMLRPQSSGCYRNEVAATDVPYVSSSMTNSPMKFTLVAGAYSSRA